MCFIMRRQWWCGDCTSFSTGARPAAAPPPAGAASACPRHSGRCSLVKPEPKVIDRSVKTCLTCLALMFGCTSDIVGLTARRRHVHFQRPQSRIRCGGRAASAAQSNGQLALALTPRKQQRIGRRVQTSNRQQRATTAVQRRAT